VRKGERLVIFGRKENGSTTLLRMLAGEAPLSSGCIKMHGNVAYAPEDSMILVDTLFKNLAFFDETITEEEVHSIALYLDLYNELAASNQLD
jgi:ABC-type polysaccharide/polyol phosphate transport system ATPase subunit